jgi:O-acetylhomoserine/O-acetylserine sulfhydrylase-like pyridoxal-dependent enzyme
MLRITDMEHVASLAQDNGCLFAVDNTFCSPYFQTPLDFGSDIGTFHLCCPLCRAFFWNGIDSCTFSYEIYPGLPSHPQHETAKKLQRGFGDHVLLQRWLKGNIRVSGECMFGLLCYFCSRFLP